MSLSSLSSREQTSSIGTKLPDLDPGPLMYTSPRVSPEGATEGREGRLAGRSGASTSEASEAFPASWSETAYAQARWDFWHWEHGHKRSHFSFLLLRQTVSIPF